MKNEKHPFILLMFTGPYCPPCRAAKPAAKAWAEENGVRFLTLDGQSQLARWFRVISVPTFVLIDSDRANLNRIFDPQTAKGFTCSRAIGWPTNLDALLRKVQKKIAELAAENCCEHGDHKAPPGKRFCSKACEKCEHESVGENGCDGICIKRYVTKKKKEARA